jgi:hypothetical protein
MANPWAASDKRKRAQTLARLAEKRCASRNCKGVTTESGKSKYCSKCRSRRFKLAHPLRYYYGKLRDRAKERGKDFRLTFEEYQSFAIKTNYALLKGKTSLSLSIDRRNNDRGYYFENVQAITLSENSRKQYVPYFANKIPNQTYEPTQEEIDKIENQIREMISNE